MALCCAVEPGSRELAALVDRHGAEAVWRSLLKPGSPSRWAARAQRLDLAAVGRATERFRLRFVIPGDDDWPGGLSDLADCEPVQDLGGAPFGLWVKGQMALVEAVARSVSIVGARACTAYGQTVTTDLAAGLGTHGITVISGGAYGIDAAAHTGALAADAPTVAVMAGGLDKPYPSGNSALLQRVANHGLLVSELPPGEHPTRVRFLARNRLIAALTPATILVEAALRSGARNTVSWASACRRLVLAVPGPVYSATSATPHRLIREAEAVLCAGVEDVLELVGPLGRRPAHRPSQHRTLDDLSPDELAVFEALPARGLVASGEVSLKAGVPLGSCLGVLDRLAERGLVAQGVDGWRLAKASFGASVEGA
jgi:DNA processing protein